MQNKINEEDYIINEMYNDIGKIKRVVNNELESIFENKENNLKMCAKNILQIKENSEAMLDETKKVKVLSDNLRSMKIELNDNINYMIKKQTEQTSAIKKMLEVLIEENASEEDKAELISKKNKLGVINRDKEETASNIIPNNNINKNKPLVNQNILRNNIILNQLSTKEKQNLYNSIKNNDFIEFSKYVNELNYSILENVSKKGKFWTAFHFAMYFGNSDIIKLSFQKLEEKKLLADSLLLETEEYKTPILLYLQSNIVCKEKLELFELLSNQYKIDLSEIEISEFKKNFL